MVWRCEKIEMKWDPKTGKSSIDSSEVFLILGIVVVVIGYVLN